MRLPLATVDDGTPDRAELCFTLCFKCSAVPRKFSIAEGCAQTCQLSWHKPSAESPLQGFCALRQPGCHGAWQSCADAPCRRAADFVASRKPKCFIEFDQKIQIKHVPPSFNRLLRRTASTSCHQTQADIDCEAELVGKGMSTLPDLNRHALPDGYNGSKKATAPASIALGHQPRRGTNVEGPHMGGKAWRPARGVRGGGGGGAGIVPAGLQPGVASITASTSSPRELPAWQRPVECFLQSVHGTDDKYGGLWRASLGNLAVL